MEIVFDKVSYSYDNKNVLEKVDLKIESGKITSIIGKSGSGKTTIAELMNGLLIPQEGNIFIDGIKKTSKNIVEENINKDIGLVFQFPEEQFFNLTVYDEVAFGLKYYKYKTEDIRKRVIESLVMVGLNESYLELNPFSLSNGEMRKIAIASILILNPKVIIFDEPTIGLDMQSKKNFIQLIRRLKNRYKKTIVLISHDIDMVHSVTDYVYVLDSSKIYLSGTKYDVFKEEDKLSNIGLVSPEVIRFSNLVRKKKGIRLGYRDNINDLIKDIYRNAR